MIAPVTIGGCTLHLGDCREVLANLPAESVDCAVTSPPYWGLRDYGCAGQIGLEASVGEYVAEMVAVFREVRRVLRPDGTLWLNLGDCYATGAGKVGACPGGGDQGERWAGRGPGTQPNRMPQAGLKPKDLVGMPWRVAFALQADGWWLRSDIIWSKLNPMPESVTDRPTKAHEYVFLLSKGPRYFYDAAAIAEPGELGRSGNSQHKYISDDPKHRTKAGLLKIRDKIYSMVNARTVWTIATQRFGEAHFATMPPELASRCIIAGTSEKGCCRECGAPWERVIEKQASGRVRQRATAGLGTEIRRETHGLGPVGGTFQEGVVYRTVGWRPTCPCDAGEPVPCTVLDPFGGAGTTGLVAERLQRRSVLVELNPAYRDMAAERIRQDAPLLALGDAA